MEGCIRFLPSSPTMKWNPSKTWLLKQATASLRYSRASLGG